MANTGLDYELLTKEIFLSLRQETEVNNLIVRHNVVLQGKTGPHQIDVYWKFETLGIQYETIVQAKDWSSRVKKGQLLEFHGVLNDIPSHPKGVFVTRSGYQKGAKDYAKAHGILLYELFEEKRQAIKIKTSTLGFVKLRLVPMEEMSPKAASETDRLFLEAISYDTEVAIKFQIDPTWMKGAPQLRLESIENAIAERMTKRLSEIAFYDDTSAVVDNLHRICKTNVDEMTKTQEFQKTFVHPFARPTFIQVPTEDDRVVKVNVQAVECSLRIRESEKALVPVRAKGVAKFILKNVLAGNAERKIEIKAHT